MRIYRSVLTLTPALLAACFSATNGGDGTVGNSDDSTGEDSDEEESGSEVTGGASGSSSEAESEGDASESTTEASEGTTQDETSGTSTTTSAEQTSAGSEEGDTEPSDETGPTETEGETAGPMTCPYTAPEDPSTFPEGWSRSDITVFNENGGWTWYNDERVVVDVEAGKIVISSAASSANSEGSNTSIDAVIHDIATGANDKMSLGSLSYSDDHNNGGIVIKAPGEYFVAWAHHNVDCNTYWRNYGSGSWGQQVTHRWGEGCPWGTRPDNITYNNPWKMSAEGRYYNFIRSINTSPNFLVSEDEGQNWTYGGRLTASPQQGYNAGYYKYWGNGVDRIDFFATEAHPRDANTSVFHGYVQDGKSYDSSGQEIDGNIFDGDAPQITEFTRVFGAGSMIQNVALNHLWNLDVARYEDGTIGVLWQGREGGGGKDNPNPNHRLVYSRFDGTGWTSTYLVRAGRTLYRDQSGWWEEDYVGGAALDPDNPHVVYVSTPIDPRDDSTTNNNHEIWKGVTCDDGASFTWTPITMNSPNENLRPVVPKWDGTNTAVLWFRGRYNTAQRYGAQVVGIITTQE